jgi:peptidoglycan/LPS O-acetylase OafA/YrhL
MARPLGWIEVARTLACSLVVLAHVNIYIRAGLETWWPGGFGVVPFLALAVPIFFVIAGYVAESGMASRGTSADWLGRRLQRLLPPFFAWNVLTLLVLSLTGGWPGPLQVAEQLTTGTWHLYFIFALAQLLILHAFLRRTLDSPRLSWVLGVAVAGTAAAFATSEALLWTLGADTEGFEAYARKVFLVWAGFYALGVWRCRRGPLIKNSRSAVVLAGLILIAYAGYIIDLRLEDHVFSFTPRKQLMLGGLPFQFLGAIVVIESLQHWEQNGRMRRLFQAVGRPGVDSFGIYLSHIVVLALLWKGWELAGAVRMSWFEVPLFTVATWLCSFMLVRAMRAINSPRLSLGLLGERTAPSRPSISIASAETGVPVR